MEQMVMEEQCPSNIPMKDYYGSFCGVLKFTKEKEMVSYCGILEYL